MRKKLLLSLVGATLVLALVTVPFMLAFASKEEAPSMEKASSKEAAEPKVVKVGWLNAMTGPISAWSLALVTGTHIWEDAVNAAGGLKVGAERHPVKMVYYDNESLPDKAVMGAKKLVLQDKVDLVLPGWGETLIAVQPFLNEQKIINIGLDPRAQNPNYPYLLSVAGMFPFYYALEVDYALEAYPEIKRVAYARHDWAQSEFTAPWFLAAFEANDVDLVYYEKYSTDITDAAPLISAILAKDPDLICFGTPPAGMDALFIEQLYIQGYKGKLLFSEFLMSDFLAKAPLEWLEARKCIAAVATWDDPGLSDEANNFYDAWMARYGPGGPEDQKRSFYHLDWFDWVGLKVWQLAVESTGSLDSTTVRDWLLAQDTIPHPISPAAWWGEEINGNNNTCFYQYPITELKGGKNIVADMRSFTDWWNKGDNKRFIIDWYTDHNMMWWQQQ
jgi:branched-chain amino acid transport system substrate-binding protein